jgi:hypothetical protein
MRNYEGSKRRGMHSCVLIKLICRELVIWIRGSDGSGSRRAFIVTGAIVEE